LPSDGSLEYERTVTRAEDDMKRTLRRGGRISIAVLAAAALLSSTAPGHGQTQGMERRQKRRENRDDARATRQEGRHTARDAKQACKDAVGNRIDCRHQKREIKQDARGAARDQKYGTGSDAAPNQ
jgi:hypothetical protein